MAGINNTFLCLFFLSILILGDTVSNVNYINDINITLRKCCYDEEGVLEKINGSFLCTKSFKQKPKITVYYNKGHAEDKKIHEDFHIQSNSLNASNFTTYYYCRVMDDGTLRTFFDNNLLTNSCFEFAVNESKELVPICLSWDTQSTEVLPKFLQDLHNIALFMSSLFLVIVLSIYFILEKIRNLNGLMSMTWVLCVLAGLLDVVIIRVINFKLLTCKVLLAKLYFFTLSSFSWMTVISFDIWLMSRNSHQVNPRRSVKKVNMLLKYSIVAFAGPSIMGIIQYFMKNTNESDKHITREVTCPIIEREKNIYLYLPAIVLILCSTLFYVLTEINLRKHFQDTRVLYDSSNKRRVERQKSRLWLFITLSAVLELLWVFEVVSAQFQAYRIYWYVPDLINCLKGVWIFVIFILKGQTCKLLKQKLLKKNVNKEVKVICSLDKDKELSTSFKLQNISTTDESG